MSSAFELYNRNAQLCAEAGLDLKQAVSATSTGTTIVGCKFNDPKHGPGVVLGADTRATGGAIVVDKVCDKIHKLATNIYCCGSGTAADAEHTTKMLRSVLALHSYQTNKKPKVITALTVVKQHLFKHQGHISVGLLLGGVDDLGAHLFKAAPHGSTDTLPYVTDGSGSLAAMAVFESKWREGLEREEAMALVSEAIEFGVINDLGSGSNVDLRVITATESTSLRNFQPKLNPRIPKALKYNFPPGTTAIKKQSVRNFIVSDQEFTFLSANDNAANGGLGEKMEITA